MSSTSIDSSPNTSHVHPSERPLIVAAYHYGAPYRKRRVKVPPNINWKDFLGLLYNRLNISPDFEIEIYDEKGIEIVSVEDLVENELLVVREKLAKKEAMRMEKDLNSPFVQTHEEFQSHDNSALVAKAVASSSHSHRASSSPMGVPQLAHFIQSNSFGFYFLAEVETMKLLPTQGKVRRTHCIVKVPHSEKAIGSFQTFESEANLLRKISSHKCVISAPVVQILNFSDENLQRFYSSLSRQKQSLLGQLFMGGGCTEAYVYPLYGVTMATKIKTGLTPDKVLKYSYQLADIMHYLQQRGVIHQNLLPENIQVMSNDRLVVCNFETAIQTDPTTCLLVVSRSVVAPSNRKGLAPEVISAFARLRIETETVDYSTQYPWSFGILSVVMATGQHPLKDYPMAYETSGRVKYRSYCYQALPNAEQYPPIFCKVVKRSLSCDPIRRPTLPQILSIIKKDSKILNMMTGKNSSVPIAKPKSSEQERAMGDSVPVEHQVTDLYNYHRPQLARLQAPTSSRGLHHTHPPIPPPPLGYQRTSSDEVPSEQIFYQRSSQKRAKAERHSAANFPDCSYHPASRANRGDHVTSHESNMTPQNRQMTMYGQQLRSRVGHMGSYSGYSAGKHDPFLPVDSQRASNTPRPRESWHSFSDEVTSAYPPAGYHGVPRSQSADLEGFPLRTYGSQGAFSDDFVVPGFSKQPSPSDQQLLLDATRTSSKFSEGHHAALTRPSCTSESDLSQYQDVQYRRLIPSPNAVSSDERSPNSHPSDQERLIQRSSSELEQDLRPSMGEILDGNTVESGAARVQKRHTQGDPSRRERRLDDVTLGMPLAKVSRTLSYKVTTGEGRVRTSSPLVIRRCFSDGEKDPQQKETSGVSSDLGVTQRYRRPEVQAGRAVVGAYLENQRNSRAGSSGAHQWFSDSGSQSERFPSSEECAHEGHMTSHRQQTRPHVAQQVKSRDRFQLARDSDRSREVQGQNGKVTAHAESESQQRHSQISALPSNDGDPSLISNQQFWTGLLSGFASEGDPKSGQYLFSLENSITGPGEHGIHADTPSHMTSRQPQSVDHSTSRDETLMQIGSEGSQNASKMTTQDDTITTTTQTQPGLDTFPEALSVGDSQAPILASEAVAVQDEPMSLEELSPKQPGLTEEMEASTTHQELSYGMEEFQSPPSTKYQHSSSRSAVISSGAPNSWNAGTAGWFHDGNQGAPSVAQGGYNMSEVPHQYEQSELGTLSGQGSGGVSVGQAHQKSLYSGTPVAGCTVMSPIPEASQECSSSQTNTNGCTERLSSSQMHSASPMDQTQPRSVSPFRHSALPEGVSSPRSQSTISDHGSTAQSSATTALRNQQISEVRESTPQLEPPNSDTSSHSRRSPGTSVEDSITSSAQAQVSDNTLRSATVGATNNQGGTRSSNSPERQRTPRCTPRHSATNSRTPSAQSDLHVPGSNTSQFPSRSRSGTPLTQRLSDYPLGPRISQDIEMLNLAISGMDSQTQREDIGRIELHQRSPHSYQLAASLQTQPHSSMAPRHRPNLEASREFRPITPSLPPQSRSVSAGPAVQTANVRTEPETQQIPDTQLSGMGVSADPHSVRRPPQSSTDSYDYLPPYSPPRDSQLERQRQLEQQRELDQQRQLDPRRQLSNPPLYPEPPPSYEEIFGRHRHRHRQHGYSPRYAYGSQERSDYRRGGGGSPSSYRPLTRQTPNQRRLSSLTNLFRRTRRQPPSGSGDSGSSRAQQRSEAPSPDSNDYTARWVASYNHTPRPTDHINFRGDNFSVISSGSTALHSHTHSQTSRTMSDITSSRLRRDGHPPVPYRHPPPFPSAESIPQLTENSASTVTSRNIGQPRSSANSSAGNIATETHTNYNRHHQHGYQGNRRSQMTRREFSHDRQRPFSAVYSSDAVPPNVDISQLNPEHSQSGTNIDTAEHRANGNRRERLRNLVTSSGISTSCFDILSTPESQQRTRQTYSTGRENEGRPQRPGSLVQSGPAALQTTNPVLASGVQATNSSLSANANANNINTANVTASPRSSNATSPDNPEGSASSATSTGISNRTNARIRAASRRTQHAAEGSSSDEASEQQNQSQPRTRLRLRRRRHHSGSTQSQRGQMSQEPAEVGGEIGRQSTSESVRAPCVRQQSPNSREQHAPPHSVVQNSRTGLLNTPATSQDQHENQSEPNLPERSNTVPPQPEETGGGGRTSPAGIEEVQTVRGRQQVEGEIQIVEITIDSPDSNSLRTEQLSSSGKPCGHSCVAEEQELCCLCTKDLQEITRLAQNCLLCERRTGSEEELREVPCSCHGNKTSSTCAVHSRGQRSSPQQLRRGGRNCNIM